MFLHIIPDEKFIDSAYAAFETAAPNNNKFVIVGDKVKDLVHINSFTPERVTLAEALSNEFIITLETYRLIFIHSLDRNAKLIIHASQRNRINYIWIGFGYDYYNLVFSKNELYLPETARSLMLSHKTHLISKKTIKTRIAVAAKNPKNLISSIKFKLLNHRINKNNSMHVIKKISVFSPVLPEEYKIIDKKFGSIIPAYATWNYGTTARLFHDFTSVKEYAPTEKHTKREFVIVGNCATPENNHLDTFILLKNINYSGKIICPLSYGNDDYSKTVKEKGTLMFGANFIALTTFMPLIDYFALFQNASALIISSIRQQGLGNIYMALYSGCNVVLHQKNPAYLNLTSNGFKILTTLDIKNSKSLTEPSSQAAINKKISAQLCSLSRHNKMTHDFIKACLHITTTTTMSP